MQYLYFTVNKIWLALDISHVDEILIPEGPIGMVSGSGQMSGEIKYGEKNIPLINLRESLFAVPYSQSDAYRIIVCSYDGKQFALQVDTAEEIAGVNQDNIGEAGVPEINFKPDYAEGVIREENRTYYILSLKQLAAVPRKA